jgi:carbonic anhydrase/acetyltransferase-like protein (isoleucine patch superfamily)
MNTSSTPNGIRANFLGIEPKVDATSFVDPSSQIMGNVQIGPNVYIGPLTVIRADEADPEGKVHPVIIENGACIQDGVIIHARAGTEVKIGPRVNIAHGAIIHGPCVIGERCFIALRGTIYKATLEESVWVGIGAIIMRATIPANTMVPAGSIVRDNSDVRYLRMTNVKEIEYQKDVFEASAALREGYKRMYGK